MTRKEAFDIIKQVLVASLQSGILKDFETTAAVQQAMFVLNPANDSAPPVVVVGGPDAGKE